MQSPMISDCSIREYYYIYMYRCTYTYVCTHTIYEQRVREVERASFTPLVFSALGGMSRPTEITYKRLASLLADKKDQFYNSVISLIRCRLGFSLLRSAIMCLRGSRSTAGHPLKDFVLAGAEGRLPLTD